ncbi:MULTISPECIES: MFS transporter [Luteimonas]|uniref:MFS transporter n=1 Tax=Luteimonas chenhongjianii TaxID=2006110 RepID=A0A290XEJ3_9GAMM|nr:MULTISPECIES: MFS transporter [Luteimonas]ATD67438.1 MFS transporter [Luteimonas chenhongjianii]RPD85879.1 MFS transporter [Luteimonas sp. 100069]
MSETAQQATTGLDEAPETNDEREISPGKIAFPVVMGRTSEFFDFFVYGIAAVLVFPYLFFPDSDPVQATLKSFAVFSLAFIARPIGSVIFMAVDRNFSRAAKLIGALFLLCGSTMAIAFLPSYAQVGALAPILLAVFRFGQGLGWGGAWDGLPSLLSLSAPRERRGWYAMVPQLGAALGFMLACGMFLVFTQLLNEEDFMAWGWRFPFFVALALNVVALFARLRLVVTPEFVQLFKEQELQPRRVVETIRTHPRQVFIGALIPLASYAMFHLVTIFPLSWATLYTDHDATEFLGSLFLGAIVGGLGIMLSGILAERIGRRGQLAVAAVLIAVFSFFAAPLLGSDTTSGRTTYVVVGFALLGLSLGQASNAIASRFESIYRYTGAAVTSDIAWLVGAGFAPLVALWLCSEFGLAYVGYYLLSGAVVTLAALAFSRTLETVR